MRGRLLSCNASYCSSCDNANGYYLLPNNQCGKGYVSGSYLSLRYKRYYLCNSPCKECKSDSSQDCISCVSNYYQIANSSDKRCIYSLSGYFIKEGFWFPCNRSCLSCVKESECNTYSCNTSQGYYYLSDKTRICSKAPVSGYYFSGSSFDQCHFSCEECVNSTWNWSKCKSRFYKLSSNLYNICYATYDNSFVYNNVWVGCKKECLTCDNINNCLLCSSEKGYYNRIDDPGKCFSLYSPISGYYADVNKKMFLKCHASCTKCSWSDSCIDCACATVKYKKTNENKFCYEIRNRAFTLLESLF
jgi:hypothetical protein